MSLPYGLVLFKFPDKNKKEKKVMSREVRKIVGGKQQ